MGLFSSTYATLKDRQISKIQSEFPAWLGTLKETKAQGYAFYIRPEWGGAVISLRNLDEPEKYKSAEFGFIAVDELTEHAVETFDILRGSMRWPGLDKPVFVAGTNPDGIGNEWCFNYFIDKKFPDELKDEADQFIFVQSLPSDNPHLPESYWKMLKTLPDDLRKAWLEGDWKVFKGRAFKEFSRKTHVIPQQEIPEHWTRLIGIDWGYRAPFCALFGARDPDTGRVIIYKEIYESELTDRQQARKILDISDEKELQALRYADPSMWKKATQENVTSTAQIYAEQGCWIRQGENDRLGGKRKVDRMLTNLPDGRPGLQITENVRALPRQLELLVYDPQHQEDVNCFVKGTMVSTPSGQKPIEDIKIGDLVCTPIGNRKVICAGVSGYSHNILKVSLSNGETLTGTADHKVFVLGKGLVPLKHLFYHDILIWKNISRVGWLWRLAKLFTRASRSEGQEGNPITDPAARISSRVSTCSTEKSTKTISVQSLKDMISTTSIITTTIMTLQTWSPYPSCSMLSTTTKLETKPQQSKSVSTPGTIVQRGKKCSGKTPGRCESEPQNESKRAQIVALLLRLTTPHKYYVKTADVISKCGERISNLLKFAPSVAKSLRRLTQRLKPVRINAVGNYGAETVYNLTVEEAHLYYANNILVTNTRMEDHAYDALRYLLTAAREYQPGKDKVAVKGTNPYSLLEKI